MPTATFFRLPQEKRERLMDACWAELSRVRFSDVSINRIVSAARIPRGSFYQYFGGKDSKEELFRFFLEDVREYFIRVLRSVLTEGQGDLFALPLMAYDRFIGHQGYTDPMLSQLIKIVQLNEGMDMQSLMGGPMQFLPNLLGEALDPSKLREPSRKYADHVFHMTCAVLAFAIVETLQNPGQSAQVRGDIKLRVDLLRYGGAAEGYKEEIA